ncbi:MAG: beta-phosphoglucomutase [Chloroflexota bacterium]|nr:beta-phosphoglucomutase [Chloroflexota bacterium]
MTLKAVIFDLDGVLTETAEFHYRGWQRLADEEGLPFSREKNEQLRGISRQRSLELILEGRELEPERVAAMLERKNRYYQEMLNELSNEHLLPGIPELLDELEAADVKMAVGSASKNARTVLDALGITERFETIADGHSVKQGKPAPDLFLFAAQEMGVEPHECVVVEDAESGIDAALTGGFATVGIGPEERVGHAHLRLDDTAGLTLEVLREARRRADNWRVLEEEWRPGDMHHKETVFTVGNGLLASRGVFEEGYVGERRTTFVHGIFDDVPIVFTELANAPDWMAMDILLEGERFGLESGELLDYRRTLDLRSGLLTRTVRWQSPEGNRTQLRFERFMSMANRNLLAIRVEITPENWAGSVEIRASLFGHTENLGTAHWRTEGQGEDGGFMWLQSRTRKSGIHLALAGVVQRVDGNATVDYWDAPGLPTQRLRTMIAEGNAATITKLVTIADSRHVANPRATVLSLLASSLPTPFDVLLRRSRAAWGELWETSDVEIDGDDEAQLALRYNIFQMLAVAPQEEADDASIGAKTLSGFGYRGHVFWDTELFMLPLFTFTQPQVARNLLLYRYRRLDAAREKARANGYEGAQFPWESAGTGEEVTPTWIPHWEDRTRLIRVWTGDIEIHITADIAYAVMQYWHVTGDDAFMSEYGAEMVLSGAVFWGSRVEWNEEARRYELTDVIGPDEYHDHVDNNVFTNAMVRWHLQTALRLLDWLDENVPEQAEALREKLGLTPTRLEQWRDVIARIWILEDEESGLMEQFEGYFALQDPNLADFEPRTRSMHEILGIEGANAAQIIKQPDVMMLLFLMRDQVTMEQIRVNWNYYDPRTDHTYGSSLGPAITAIMACEMGELDVAYEHFMRALRADLYDVRGNAADGIHAASAGAVWQSATMGFGGLTVGEDGWKVEARLPSHWRRLAFTFLYHGERQDVELVNDRFAPASDMVVQGRKEAALDSTSQ